MSIATDEADREYPIHTDVDDPMYKYVEAIAGNPAAKRQGYVAGRTAEPTEAEIKAAMAAWDMHEGCGFIGHPIMCTCGREFSSEHEFDAHVMRCVLESVRKAVM